MAYGNIFADTLTNSNNQVAVSTPPGFRNRIINGAMMISQRGTSFTGLTDGSSQYTLDRWRWAEAGAPTAVQSVAQDTTAPTGFVNSLKVTTTTAQASLGTNDNIRIAQVIEGTNCADLAWGTANAKTVTVSFWVYSNLTGTFGGALMNDNEDRSYPFTYTINSANTWEQKSVTIAGDTTGTWLTTTGAGIKVIFSMGAGATRQGTAGAWAAGFYPSATSTTNVTATLNATWYITGVQLELGSSASSFDYRPYGTELALCQRYYEKSYNMANAPASVLSDGGGTVDLGLTSNGSGHVYFTIPYKVSKRGAATVTAYDNNGNSGQWEYSRSGASGTATIVANAKGENQSYFRVASVGANWVACEVFGAWVASAEL